VGRVLLGVQRALAWVTMWKSKKKEDDSFSPVDRYLICRECEHFYAPTRQCKECGCFLALKVKSKSQSCPIGKW
jgi:hypothetical protein